MKFDFINICGISYIIFGFLIILTSVFVSGYVTAKHPYEKEFIGQAIMIAVFWPVFLGLALFFAPFWGLFKLGEWFGHRQNDILKSND